MLNKEKVRSALAQYKYAFPDLWKDEQYKWKAVKWFQDNWDINAKDFAGMLERALDQKKTENLLVSRASFPAEMIIRFAKGAPEEVRSMYTYLFDETKDLWERIAYFKQHSNALLKAYDKSGSLQHYQRENAIMTYLWLQYPDKYYIYKYSEVKTNAEVFDTNYIFKSGAYSDNIRNFMAFYDELNAVIREDKELVDMFRSALTADCYPDPELRTLTIDAGFFWGRFYGSDDEEEEDLLDLTFDDWGPSLDKYTPGLTKKDWLNILNNKDIIGPEWGGVLAAFYAEKDGAATCTQIAQKYGKPVASINGTCIQLARRIHKETACPVMLRDNTKKGKRAYWPILFMGKNADKDIPGVFIWKLRPELYEALEEFGISRFQWPVAETYRDVNYWWLNAKPNVWSFSELDIGDEESYTTRNDDGNLRMVPQNFKDAKPGDLVIGYESFPVMKVVALCTVSQILEGESEREEVFFKKTENLENPIDYAVLKNHPKLANMEVLKHRGGSLFKLTKEEYDTIISLIRGEEEQSPEPEYDKYTKKDFLDEVYVDEEYYNDLVEVLNAKKNIILQGAPGVGKTFAAKRLAWSMIGEKNPEQIEFIQFHQNYSYEDFVMGYKPVGEGFELKYGVFYRFCVKAKDNPDKKYFFIIDEINRGNMSKIFGELLMLIENDHRGEEATLAYDGAPFTIPKNVYLIGMMNTADRSLAMIDYALRRRFSFFDMEPAFGNEMFIHYKDELKSKKLDSLISKVKELNEAIARDRSLGKGFCIGHSYFCGQKTCTDTWLASVVKHDILPMLREYWFDNNSAYETWKNNLEGIVNDKR